MKNHKKRQQLKYRWQELWSSCSFDGFHYIFKEKGFLRFFWILVVLGAITLSVFLFYGVLEQFFSYSESTTFEEVLGNDKVDFPTVTICNLNAVSKKKVEANPYNMTLDQIVDFYQDIRSGVYNPARDNEILDIFRKQGVTSMHDIFKQYEITMSEILNDEHLKTLVSKPCQFKDHTCDEKDFIEVISAKYGLCYQFNSIYLQKEKGLFANKAGEGSGLRLYMNIHEEDLLVSNVPFNGLQVFIHPFGEPFESAIARRVPVSPGSMNFIHIDYMLANLLKHPYPSNCSSIEYSHLKSIVPYSRSMCSIDHLVSKMLDECGCAAAEISSHLDDDVKLCDYHKLQCIQPILEDLEILLHKFQRKCPRQCEVVKYGIVVGATSMGNPKVYKALGKKHNMTLAETHTFIEKNIFGIDVSFSDIVYMRETLSPAQNWVTVLSAIGGSLGLAMGCSVVTFLEFIVFGFQAMYYYVRYCNTDDDGDCEENGNAKRETTAKKELENFNA